MIHATKELVHGKRITRCGLTVKVDEASVWESDVTCEKCGIKRKFILHEPSKRSSLTLTKSTHIDKEKGDREMARSAVLDIDKALVEQVVKLRQTEEKKWDEINEITGVATGKCMLAFSLGTLPKKDFVKNPTAADVIRLRGEGLSWGDISVRTMLSESTCRTMFTTETGESTKGSRIGKGGRFPGNGVAAEPKAAKSTTAKATRPAKAAAPANELFADVADEEVAAMITGYAIKVDMGDGTKETIAVKSVKKTAKGKVVLVDAKSGESRTLKLAAISAISKKKAL